MTEMVYTIKIDKPPAHVFTRLTDKSTYSALGKGLGRRDEL